MLHAKPMMLFLTTMAVATLAGCGTSAPGDVAGLRRVVGVDLLGARGANDADQRKIDRTVVRLCAGGIWRREECTRHGEALK